MSAALSRWRRLAVQLVQHAASALPGARAPWAEAMRRELDYIADDSAALRWALGCIIASYRTRLTQWFMIRPTWRQFATSGALMVLIGLALQENAGGQTQPLQAVCDEPTLSQMSSRPEASVRLRPAEGLDRGEHDRQTCEAIYEKDRAQEQGPRGR